MERHIGENTSVTIACEDKFLGERGKRVLGLLSVLSLVQMVVPWGAVAENVNLGSSDQSHTVDSNYGGGVSIVVDGQNKQVNGGDKLTGAEYATFLNAISGVGQTLTIGQGGVATGGSLNVSPALAGVLTGLSVPTNVNLLHDFGNGGVLNFTGNLSNSGNFYAYSTNSAVTNAVINAGNLYNNQGALLTTVLPAGGLSGISNAISNLSLTLNVLSNLVNAGTISSAGNLNVNAGAIYNQLPAGLTGPSPIMQAVNNLNLNTTLGNLTNSGTLAAITGNVNIASLNNLVVNNVNGTISALNGSINVRDLAFTGKQSVELTGGDFVSKFLNINNDCGKIAIEVNKITGVLNAKGSDFGVTTNETLTLGNLDLSGDPGAIITLGDLNIAGSMSFPGQPLALIAAGNVRTTVAGLTIGTANPGGAGGNILISAGGLVSSAGVGSARVSDRNTKMGGSIDFSTFALASAIRSDGGAGNAGNITMLTLGGEQNPGTISIAVQAGPDAITANATGGIAGNITIYSDAKPGNVNSPYSIDIGGNINALGTLTPAKEGGIRIATAKPNLSTAGDTSNPTYTVTGFELNYGMGQTQPYEVIQRGETRDMSIRITGGVSTTGGTQPGGLIDILAGKNLVVNGGVSSANGAVAGDAGNITLATNSLLTFQIGGFAFSNLVLQNGVTGTVSADATGAFKGGTITVTNSGTGGVAVNNLISAASTGGEGGTITLAAPTGNVSTALGANVNGGTDGGTITVNARTFALAGNFNANGTGGKGGNITLSQTLDGQPFSMTGAANYSATGITQGGKVTVSAAGALTINPAFINVSTAQDGGSLDFSTTGSNQTAALLVTQSLNVDGVGNGKGGSIKLSSILTSADFTVTGGAATTNGVQGTLSASGTGNGDGGSITVSGGHGVSIQGQLSARGGGKSGAGGRITIAANGSEDVAGRGLLLNTVGLLDVRPFDGAGGEISITSADRFILTTPGTFDLNAAGATGGNGGSFTFSGLSLAAPTFFNVNANAAVQGNGGKVSITTVSAFYDLLVGNVGVSAVGSISVNGAAVGAAGTVSISGATNTTVTMAGISATPGAGGGAGATFTFSSAGKGGGIITPGDTQPDAPGLLRVVGNIVADGLGTGRGGSVTLKSNSATQFTFNGLSANGLSAGLISAKAGTTGAGGDITIDNAGTGGVAINAVNFNVTPIDGNGGRLTFNSKNGTVNVGAGIYSVDGVSAANAATGGSFTVNANGILIGNVAATTITANAGVTGGSGGSISLTATGGASSNGVAPVAGDPFTVAGGGTGLSLSARGSAGGTGGGGGTITVSMPGALTVASAAVDASPQAGQGTGANYNFKAGTLVRAGLSITGGGLNSNAIDGGGGSIKLSATDNLAVAGALTANGAGAGNAGGEISIIADGPAAFLVAGGGVNGTVGGIFANGPNGSGGNISITNPNGINIQNLTMITATSGGAMGGSGGQLKLVAENGTITINGAAQNFIDLNASGTNGSGGRFELTAQNFAVTNGPIQLRGQGVGSSSGGSFIITSKAANGDLTIAAVTGQFTISGAAPGPAFSQLVNNGLPITVGTTVLQIADTSGFAVGQTVIVSNGTTMERVAITAVTPNVSITVVPLANAYATQPTARVAIDSSGNVTLASGRNLTVTMADVVVAPTVEGPGPQFNFSAGTSGAPATLLVTGNINAQGVGGTDQPGGTVTLSSSGNLLVNGSINTFGVNGNPAGGADGGGVTLTSNSSSVFDINPAGVGVVNGVVGTINTNGGTGGGRAGNLSITNNGVGGVHVRNNTGDITMVSKFAAGPNFSVMSKFGEFSIDGGPTSTINVDGHGGTSTKPSEGGAITINAQSISVGATSHLALFARGGGVGRGGSVTLNASGASSFLEVHGSNLGAIDIHTDAAPAGGDGGKIDLTVGTRMVIDPTAITNQTGAASTGQNMNFTATGQAGGCCGSILFTGPVNFAGQTTGVIVNVNSINPFTIGTPGTSGNGIVMNGANVAVDMSGTGGSAGGTFTVRNGGDGGITISPNAQILSKSGPTNSPFRGGFITLDAGKGTLTFSQGLIDVSAPGSFFTAGQTSVQADGGTVNISATKLAVGAGATGPLVINAAGGAGAKGGTVNITTTDNSTALNIGNAAGQFSIDARGGAVGGTLNFRSAFNLTVNPTFALFGQLLPQQVVPPGFNVVGFDGGSVTLNAGQLVNWQGALDASGVGVGSGGSVVVNQTGFNPFAIGMNGFTNSGINGAFSIAAGTLGGSGGTVDITTNGSILVNGPFTFNANATGTAGQLGGSFDGGTVKFSTTFFSVQTLGTVTMTANGNGNGKGGTIDFNHRNAMISVGGANPAFAFSATGGSVGSLMGDGGSIKLASNQSIMVNNMALLNAGPLGANGKGASYDLAAGASGILFLNGTLNASASTTGTGVADGGKITLTQSNTTFGIGVGSTSGVNGNILAFGGLAGGKGGSITLNTAGANFLLQTGAIVSANAAAGVRDGDGGSITVNIAGVNFNGVGAAPQFSADSGLGKGGTISFTSTLSPIAIGTGSTNVSFIARGGTAGSAVPGDGGSITVSAPQLTVSNLATAFNADPRGTIGKGATYSLTSGSGLIVNAGLSANAATIGGDGGSITLVSKNGGSFMINPGAPIQFNGIAGNLSANAGSATGAGGRITVQNTLSGITIGAAATFSAKTGADASKSPGQGIITINATGDLSILAPTINVSSTRGADLSLTGATINTNGNNLVITSNGSFFDGGLLTLRTTQPNTTAANLTIGKLANQIQLIAQGGVYEHGRTTAGGIDVQISGLTLTVDPTAIDLRANLTPVGSYNGGKITLGTGFNTASQFLFGNLFISGPLNNVNGNGLGNGGTVVLNTTGTNIFTINPGATVNGVNGTISASAGATGGNGGSITVNNTSGNAGGGLAFGPGQTLFVNAGLEGTAGKIDINAKAGPSGSVLPIQFLGASVFNANGVGTNGKGGTISISAARFVFGGSNVAVSAIGSGTGDGGAVTIASTGVSGFGSDIVIGALANQFSIDARGGSVGSKAGNGGSATITVASTTNSITVTPTSLLFNPQGKVGNGGTLTLSSGTAIGIANIFINASINANGASLKGNGGTFKITNGSNNPAFSIFAGATTNGVNGTISANGGGTDGDAGTIDITSTTSQGIALGAGPGLIVTPGTSSGKGGTIKLTATAAQGGMINLGTAATPLNVDGSGHKEGGTITLNSQILTTNTAGNQALSARGAGTGKGGAISITTTSSLSPININNNNGSMLLRVDSTGVGGGGKVTLSAVASVNLNAAGLQLLGLAGTDVGATVDVTAGAGMGFGNLVATGLFNVGFGKDALLDLKTVNVGGTSIMQTAGGLFTGKAVRLTTPSSLGNSMAPIQVSVSTDPTDGGLRANSTGAGQSVFVQNVSGLPMVLDASSAGFGFNLTSNNTISVTGALNGTNLSQINLTTTANNGAINIMANVGGASFGTTTLTANGSGNITNFGGFLSGGTLNMTSTSGNIGTRASRVETTATMISANTSGNVFIFAAASPTMVGGFAPTVLLNTSSASGALSTFDYLACGSVNLNGTLNTPTLFLGTLGGDITATGTTLNTVTSLGITAANNATASKTGNLTLLRSDVTNTLNVTSTGVLTVTGNVTGNKINLNANTSIAIQANLTGTGTNSTVSLASFTGGSITRTAGLITGNTLSISTSGAVGAMGARIIADVNFLDLSGFGATNNVFIQEQNGVQLGTFGFSSVGNALDLLVTGGSLTFQSLNAGGNVLMNNVGGGIVQNTGGVVTTTNGGITVQNVIGDITLNGFLNAGGTGAISVTSVIGNITVGNLMTNNAGITVQSTIGGVSSTQFTNIATNNGNILIQNLAGVNPINLLGTVRTNVSGTITVSTPSVLTMTSMSTGFTGPNSMSLTGNSGVVVNPNSFVQTGTNGSITVQTNAAGGPFDVVLTNATLFANGTGNISITAGRNVLLGTLQTNNPMAVAGGNITVNAGSPAMAGVNGSITGTGLSSAVTTLNGNINLTQTGLAANTGGINMTGDIATNSSGSVTISSNGTAGISVRGVRTGFTGPNTIQITTTGALAPITQQAFTTIMSGNNGNVLITGAGAVSLQNITAQGTGAVTVSSGAAGILVNNFVNVAGAAVTFQAFTAGTGTIMLNGMVRSNNGNVMMTAGGALTSTINGQVTATNGDLTLSTTDAATGSINLAGALTISGTGTARTLSVTSARNMTLGQVSNFSTTNMVAGGATNLTANIGLLSLTGQVFGQGDLTIRHNLAVNTAAEQIVIGNFINLQAIAPSLPQGNVSIAITNGAVTNQNAALIVGGTVNTTTSGGGQIFRGPAGGNFTNTGTTNLNAKGANITFFRDPAAVAAVNGIVLNSNFIFADPPVPGAPVSAVNVAPSVPVSLPGVPMSTGATTGTSPAPVHQSVQPSGLMMPPAVQGLIDVIAPFFKAAPTRQDSASVGQQLQPANPTTPTAEASADTVSMSRDAGGALLQSPLNMNASTVLTGFVAKKSGLFGGPAAYMRHAHHAMVTTSGDGTYDLKHGELIVSASRRSTVSAGAHTVDAAAGSIVHVTREGDLLKVRNLCDSIGKAVRVMVGGKSVTVGIGEELVVGPNDGSVDAAVKGDNIGRRKISRFVVDGNHSLIKSELSIIALIQKSNLLTSMYTKGSSADKNVMERVMKMAAALFQVTGKRGAYQAYDPEKAEPAVPLRSQAPSEDETVKVARAR